MNAAPAFKTASMNAKAAHSPYGILITTTPGDFYCMEFARYNILLFEILWLQSLNCWEMLRPRYLL